MKNLFTKLLLTSGMILSSNLVLAQEYNNYYVDYMYNNYLKDKSKKTPKIVFEDVNVDTNTTSVIQTDMNKEHKITQPQQQQKEPVKQAKKEVKVEEKNATPFYFELGLGISKFRNYEVIQPQYSPDAATMEPQDTANMFVKFGMTDFLTKLMNLEFELGYVNNNKITTEQENKVYLMDYNQKVKTYTLGANISYNFLGIDNMFVPFINFGGGVARFELSDYGKTKDSNGYLYNFESGKNTKNTIYGKIGAGLMYKMDATTRFTIGADYFIYKDYDLKNLNLQDLSRINIQAGLRFYF